MSGLLTGICIGCAMAAILWDEEWSWRTFIKYHVAALGIAFAIYLSR